MLGTAADRVGASAWRRHLYALSGVSGGSLGAAVHVVELATEGSPTNLAQRAEAMLAQDHLSPVTAFMLYPDLLQRFLPFPVAAFDRARALEMSWEKSGHDVLGVEAFSEPFGTLWSGRYHSMPALLLNSTRVETGQRAIVSSLELSNDFLDAVDLLQRPANGRPDGSGYPLRSFDTLRLSTFLTQRILARCHGLEAINALASSHHERLDGSGYHRGLTGDRISKAARILAAADAFKALTSDRPWRTRLAPDAAARTLGAEVKQGKLAHDAVEAVLGVAGHGDTLRRKTWPSGLSDREIDVLRLISLGRTNREVAERLFISPKTVGRHIENIYAKIGVSTRPAATLFAMQHQLLS